MKKFLFICLLFQWFTSFSQNAVVYAVHDGDSYKIKMDTSETKIWVRLEGVDAPEVISNLISKDQPYGRESASVIRNLIKTKHVQVDTVGKDFFNRTLVRIKFELNGDTLDLSEYILSNGLAWAYTGTLPEDRASYLRQLQLEATNKKVGLWAVEGEKVSPRIWRMRYKR